ncbi:hypothetical protein ACI2IP_13475 [Microbacterium sp. NPDC090218]
MSRLPDSRPSHARVATFRDAWHLLRVGVEMLGLAMWKFPLWRWLMIAVFGVLLLEVILLAVLLGSPFPFLLLLVLLVGLWVLSVVLVAVNTVWRLLDPNRLVLLAPDGGAVLDVIFKSRHRIALANHGRAFSATSAAGLRQVVAEWVTTLEGYELDIRAQNRAVADHYIEQFPALERSGTDWMGHTRLATRG